MMQKEMRGRLGFSFETLPLGFTISVKPAPAVLHVRFKMSPVYSVHFFVLLNTHVHRDGFLLTEHTLCIHINFDARFLSAKCRFLHD